MARHPSDARLRAGADRRWAAHTCLPPTRLPAQTRGRPPRPQLTLVSSDGTRKLTHEVEIPVHGCLLADVTDLFPEAPQLLGESGSGTLRVRDTGARLYGFYYVESDRARTVPVCHLIGG